MLALGLLKGKKPHLWAQCPGPKQQGGCCAPQCVHLDVVHPRPLAGAGHQCPKHLTPWLPTGLSDFPLRNPFILLHLFPLPLGPSKGDRGVGTLLHRCLDQAHKSAPWMVCFSRWLLGSLSSPLPERSPLDQSPSSPSCVNHFSSSFSSSHLPSSQHTTSHSSNSSSSLAFKYRRSSSSSSAEEGSSSFTVGSFPKSSYSTFYMPRPKQPHIVTDYRNLISHQSNDSELGGGCSGNRKYSNLLPL